MLHVVLDLVDFVNYLAMAAGRGPGVLEIAGFILLLLLENMKSASCELLNGSKLPAC